jgi:hypothetical protein
LRLVDVGARGASPIAEAVLVVVVVVVIVVSMLSKYIARNLQ